MPSVSGVFPEQTVQLLWIHTLPWSCQAPGCSSQRALCRLADELLCFPRGCGGSERKGHADFSEDSCKLPLPLGLCVASPSGCFAWGHPQQNVPVLGWVFVELERPQGWEQPWGSSELALRRAESWCCPSQGCCFSLMGSLLRKVCPSPQGRLFPSLWGTSFPSSELCLLHPCGSGMTSEADPTLAHLE